MKIVVDIPEVPKNDKQRWALANGTPYEERPHETLESAIDYLTETGWLPEHDRILTESPQWIPCSERLPDEDGKYLVTMQSYVSPKLVVSTSIFVSTTKEFYPDCIAWMELPEPYNKEGEKQ